LDELVDSYRRRLAVKLVVLFGSRARGDYTDESDIDVLVVADDLPRDPREAFEILRDHRYPAVNPLGYNTESFLKRLREGSTFILEVLEDGKILYADPVFYEDVMRIYREARARFIRRGRTWIQVAE